MIIYNSLANTEKVNNTQVIIHVLVLHAFCSN